MSKTFEQWRCGLLATPGDKIITNQGEWIFACGWEIASIDNDVELTRAAFWKRTERGLSCAPKQNATCAVDCYERISTWAAEEESEVDRELKIIDQVTANLWGKDIRDAKQVARAVCLPIFQELAAIKAEILKELGKK